MSFITPEVSVFKTYFIRDFNYAPVTDSDNMDYVMDADISKAYIQATMNFKSSLFGSDEHATVAFMWLSAFYLVMDLQVSAAGISSQANFPINSKSVGGVSVGFTVPTRYANDPFLSIFTSNGYGMKYLSLLIPRLVGNVIVVEGATLP